MAANTPIEVLEGINRLFPTGDLDKLLTLYDPEAVFVAQPGVVVKGWNAVREGLSQMIELNLEFELTPKKVLEFEDTALVISKWTMKDPLSGEVRVQGQSSDVVRRQPDGTWVLIIDNPHGLEWALQA
ncbi:MULTISPECIES: YybH family protein [unclassified Paenibacillus]|uniref:YybH family protein n=1 Tax=unclassified Paenibacillus TaxID=185978 RepID=UPI0036B50F7E